MPFQTKGTPAHAARAPALRLNYGSNYASVFSLTLLGCVCSCLESYGIRATTTLSRTFTSVGFYPFPLSRASRSALSIHKLLLVKKKEPPPFVYMRELMVILLSARATPSSLSCHKHPPNNLAGRHKQLTRRR